MSRALFFSRRIALAALLAMSNQAADADTLRVPRQYSTIQEAIDAAGSGDTVLVAPGIYVESLAIHDKGILTLKSEAGAESTTIDGNGSRAVIDLSAPKNSHQTEYRIDGFTIRNGAACGIKGYMGRTHVENSIFTGNRPTNSGESCGAVRLQAGGGTVRNNLMKGNFTEGIFLVDPNQVLVEGNRVEENPGGGIYIIGAYVSGPRAKVVRNIVKNNNWFDLLATGQLHVQIADNLFVRSGDGDNKLVALFGADPITGLTGTFVNNTVVATAGSSALVVFEDHISDLVFANNIIYSATDATAVDCETWWPWGVPRMHHNDVYSATGPEFNYNGYCIDEFAGQPGNLSVEPEFTTSRDGARWQLGPDSPLVDQGDNDAVGKLRRDIRGVPRIVDGGHGPAVDMGAFEFRPK